MSEKTGLKVLVVGGAGYIGSHVTKALQQVGHEPVVFDNLRTGLRQNLLPGLKFIHGDILIAPQIESAMRGMDAVVHLAALKAAGDSMKVPDMYAVHNLTGSINLLNAAQYAGVKNIVFSSSAAVYGDPEYFPMDEKHPTRPANFYGATKLQIEQLLQWWDQLKGIRYASLRYFNAAGYDVDGQINGLEQNPANLLPIVMEVVFGMRSHVEVFGTDYDTHDGSCIRDYIHVSDLARGHVLALNYLLENDQSLTVNLGTANGLSVLEIMEATKRLAGKDFDVRFGPRRLGDPAVVLAKADLAQQMLGWQAQHSDVNTLIQSMIKAYEANQG